MTSTPSTAPEPRSDRGLSDVRVIVTALALCGFVAFTGFLVVEVDAKDLTWTRYVFLYNGLSAIVFAAVGWLFGREVHRAEAENAERRASGEGTRATAAQESATEARVAAAAERERALSLAHAVRTASAPSEGGAPPGLQRMGPQRQQPSSEMGALADLAKRLYPEVE